MKDSMPENASRATEIIPTMCHGCSYGGYNCGMLAHVRDGTFVRVEGNPHHPLNRGKLCAKGQAAVQWVYNEQRLKFPLKRVGDKGSGRFQRISWEEALGTIAENIASIRKEDGPEHILFNKGQASSWGGLHHLLWLRFSQALGSPNFTSWGPSVCYNPQLTYHRQILGVPTYARPDYENADLILEWFTAGGKGGPSRGGVETLDTNLRSVPARIVERIKKGKRLVVINPQLIPLAANGRAHQWFPIRPGTDAALALAMIQEIIARDIHDRDFVETWCEGFDRLEAHIRPYTPEWAENITGIPAGDIRSLAVEYASTPRACIRISEAPQKGDLKSFAMAIPILMAITGHLDRPGGNVYFYPAGRLGFETLGKRIPDSVRNKILGSEKTYVRERGMKGADFQSIVHALLTGEPYRPRASLMFGSNPMSTARNPALVAEALKKIEFNVVVDVALTPTARLADLVLPAATRYECEWIPNLWGNHVTMSNRVVEPLWETRNELRMVLDLACRLGMEEDFWQGDYRAMITDFLRPVGVTLEQLQQDPMRGITLPGTEWMEQRERYASLFKDLPNGKIQLFNHVLERHGFNPLPVYEGEKEDPLNAPQLLEKYPLMYTDQHSDYFNHHSWMRDIPWLREIAPFPFVKIHPETGEKRGIENGDWVDILSPHGRIKAVALLFAGIRPDTLMGQHGWWQACPALGISEQGVLHQSSNPNVLFDWKLRDGDSSDISKNTLVTIRKGSPPSEEPPVEEVV